MSKYLRSHLVAAAFLLLPWPSLHATTFVDVKKTCPVGGEKFKTAEVMSYTSFGQRPDGRQYGTLPVYPLPICPKNGFVIFDEKFTKAELAILTDLVASPEYKALISKEVPFYQASWLAKKIGRSKTQVAALLMQAGWDSEDDLGRKRRYQAELAALTASLGLAAADDKENFWLALRGANALRELEEFSAAISRVEQLRAAQNFPTDQDQKDGANWLIEGLSRLNAERNPANEPTNLVPADVALARCDGGTPLGAVETEVCDKVRLAASEKDQKTGDAGEDFDPVDLDVAAAADAAALAADAMEATAVAKQSTEKKRPE